MTHQVFSSWLSWRRDTRPVLQHLDWGENKSVCVNVEEKPKQCVI